MTLDISELKRAVDMQQRSYRLLKWTASAVRDGFIDFKTAHTSSNLPEAAESWILGHYFNIPADARVDRKDNVFIHCDVFDIPAEFIRSDRKPR